MTGNRIRILELRSVRGTGGGPEKTILLGAQHAWQQARAARRRAKAAPRIEEKRGDAAVIHDAARAAAIAERVPPG